MTLTDEIMYNALLQSAKSDCGCGCNDCGGVAVNSARMTNRRAKLGNLSDLIGSPNVNVNVEVSPESALYIGGALAGAIFVGYVLAKSL